MEYNAATNHELIRQRVLVKQMGLGMGICEKLEQARPQLAIDLCTPMVPNIGYAFPECCLLVHANLKCTSIPNKKKL